MVKRTTSHEYHPNVGSLTMDQQMEIVEGLEYITGLDSLNDPNSRGKENQYNDEKRVILIQRERRDAKKEHPKTICYLVSDNEITQHGEAPFASARYTSQQIQELRARDMNRGHIEILKPLN